MHIDANATFVIHKHQIHGEAEHLRYNGLPPVLGITHRSTTPSQHDQRYKAHTVTAKLAAGL